MSNYVVSLIITRGGPFDGAIIVFHGDSIGGSLNIACKFSLTSQSPLQYIHNMPLTDPFKPPLLPAGGGGGVGVLTRKMYTPARTAPRNPYPHCHKIMKYLTIPPNNEGSCGTVLAGVCISRPSSPPPLTWWLILCIANSVQMKFYE